MSSFFVLNTVLLVFCLLLGGGLMALAWRRPNQRHRWARAVAGGVAAAALWLTAHPPRRPLPAAHAEAILLTDDCPPDTLRQLLRQLGAGTPVWSLGRATAPTAHILPSLLTLAEQRPALCRLHLLGRGLPAADLPALGSVAIVSHAVPVFWGFRTAHWDRTLTLGETCRVEGTAGLPAGAPPAWACLRAAGAVRDSVRLPAGGGAFRLRYRPKTTGLAQYELLLRRPGHLLATEPVPVEVTPPARPAVLLLASSPSPEFKFLKTYLADQRFAVALRTDVSRGLVQTEILNQPAQPLDRLTPAQLAQFTVVVADAGALAGLPVPEAQALARAVRAGSLGLILLADPAPVPRATPARADFVVLPRPAAPGVALPLAWPDGPGAQAALPAQLRPVAALRPLITGPGQVWAAAARRVGLGFVVVSVVPETFRWALQGKAPTYASFWNRLLSAATPAPAPEAAWHPGTVWPRPYQPLTLHLTAAFPAQQPTVQPLAGGPATHLALRQDPRLPEWSAAPFWPGRAGWHAITGPGAAVSRFYVFAETDWLGPELQQRQQALTQREVQAPRRAALFADEILTPWPAAWFFGLFLLAAGYLWLEEKL